MIQNHGLPCAAGHWRSCSSHYFLQSARDSDVMRAGGDYVTPSEEAIARCVARPRRSREASSDALVRFDRTDPRTRNNRGRGTSRRWRTHRAEMLSVLGTSRGRLSRILVCRGP